MRHILSSGLVAGLAAGLICALLQFVFVQPDIVLSERYESGDLVHFQGVAPQGAGHDHTMAEADSATAKSDEHAGHETGEVPDLVRHLRTGLMAVLTYAGYGLVLAGALALAEQQGKGVGRAEILLWGGAGFMAFQMLPAMGLAPELPGTPTSALAPRQIWWAGTAVASLAGMGLLAYAKGWGPRLAGLVLLALPHVLGAPEPVGFGGMAPPELAASFAARALGVGLITWLVLAGTVQRLWQGGRA